MRTAPKKKAHKLASEPVIKKTDDGFINGQMMRFCDEYMVDCVGYEAAIRAGYSPKCARSVASRLLARADIAAEIKKRQDRLSERTMVDAERVVRELWHIATADANELVEWRITCCRCCWGQDNRHQRTVAEMNEDHAAWERSVEANDRMEEKKRKFIEPFDEQGGIGYDKRKPPNPDCQQCWGEGEGHPYIKDTRTLSPEARSLYAGVKQTKEGVQMLFIDKLAALDKLMKHTGQFERDNAQKKDDFTTFLEHIYSGNSRLPIKPQ